jgi:hypothetical protein
MAITLGRGAGETSADQLHNVSEGKVVRAQNSSCMMGSLRDGGLLPFSHYQALASRLTVPAVQQLRKFDTAALPGSPAHPQPEALLPTFKRRFRRWLAGPEGGQGTPHV